MERAVVVSFAQVLDIIGGDAERVEVLESVKKVSGHKARSQPV